MRGLQYRGIGAMRAHSPGMRTACPSVSSLAMHTLFRKLFLSQTSLPLSITRTTSTLW